MIDYIKRNKVILGITVFTAALLYYFVSAEKSDWKVKDAEATAEESSTSVVSETTSDENVASVKTVPIIEAVPVKLGEAEVGANTTPSVATEEGVEIGKPQGVVSGCGESTSDKTATDKIEPVVTTKQPASVKKSVLSTKEIK